MNVVRCQDYDGPILAQRSPTVCRCVFMCVFVLPLSTVRCNSNPLHLQSVGKRGQTVENKGTKEEIYFNSIKLFALSTVRFVLCMLVTFQ